MKSSRRSKIAGDFGEMIVLYYLSRYGFECARIDHTGIDLLARSKDESAPRGISVKMASRIEARKDKPSRLPLAILDEAERACKVFNAEPYIAVVFDGVERLCILLRSVADIRRDHAGTRTLAFHFRDSDRARYGEPSFQGEFIELDVSLKAWAKGPNQPDAGHAGWTSQLAVESHRPGVPDPDCSASQI